MRISDRKKGKRIRTPKRMVELIDEGADVLFSTNEIEFLECSAGEVSQFPFASVMDGIQLGRYYEVKK